MNDAQKSFMTRSALGAAILFAVYIAAMTLANSFSVALGELGRWGAYVAALSVGFGIQVGLYTHIRDLAKAGAEGFQGSRMAVGGGVSATSMVVCCLHHVTDVLPLMGLSAATLFLADYQSVFMSLGVLSSVVGVIVMLEQIKSVGAGDTLSPRLSGLLAWYDIPRIRNVSLVASSLIFVVLLAGALGSQGVNAAPDSSTVIGSEAGVTFTINSVEYEDAVGFQMRIDTHQGNLSFDLTEVSTLLVGGTAYEPLTWTGSPPGGHHRSGELVFPKPSEGGSLSLVIRDVYGVSERVFQFGGAPIASGSTYTSIGVAGITVATLLIAYKSRKRPEEYYQSLFEAEQRRYRA